MRRPNYWLDLSPAERAEWRRHHRTRLTVEGFIIYVLMLLVVAFALSWVTTWIWLALGLP